MQCSYFSHLSGKGRWNKEFNKGDEDMLCFGMNRIHNFTLVCCIWGSKKKSWRGLWTCCSSQGRVECTFWRPGVVHCMFTIARGCVSQVKDLLPASTGHAPAHPKSVTVVCICSKSQNYWLAGGNCYTQRSHSGLDVLWKEDTTLSSTIRFSLLISVEIVGSRRAA